MFCPNCGQSQTSGNTRYCSSCGFSLRGVLSIRRKDVIYGAFLIFVGLMIIFGFHQFISGGANAFMEIAGLEGGRNTYNAEYQWSSNFILWFFADAFIIWGILRIGWALFIEFNARMLKRKSLAYARQTSSLQAADTAEALPPRQSIPVEEYATQRLDDARIAVQPAVTEGITKHLKN
ncbi:MAG TPA: zinc ribbon domain-containing protein [Pyrinomonadaceae bacterium]|jgi:hypothetical protein|nr:zinc ribbon domain-containing protein [Pyrinomonadaceae bacterium]